jgi:hypothetical protein
MKGRGVRKRERDKKERERKMEKELAFLLISSHLSPNKRKCDKKVETNGKNVSAAFFASNRSTTSTGR